MLNAFLNEDRPQMDGSLWPGIMFTVNTPRAVNSVINLQWKQTSGRSGEDPREVFLDRDKHGFDSLTYALAAVPPPQLPKPKPTFSRRVNVSAQEAFREG